MTARASGQETLLLMELGYKGYKDEQGRLFLQPPSKLDFKETETAAHNPAGINRCHSCPALFRAAPPPLSGKENFIEPESSVTIRANRNSVP